MKPLLKMRLWLEHSRNHPIVRVLDKMEGCLVAVIVGLNVLFVTSISERYGGYALGGLILLINVLCLWTQKIGLGMMATGLVLENRRTGNLTEFKGRHNPIFWKGFLLNRFTSLTPPIAALVILNVHLPLPLVLWLIADIGIAIYGVFRIEALIIKAAKTAKKIRGRWSPTWPSSWPPIP